MLDLGFMEKKMQNEYASGGLLSGTMNFIPFSTVEQESEEQRVRGHTSKIMSSLGKIEQVFNDIQDIIKRNQ
jgi:hypothetical protein